MAKENLIAGLDIGSGKITAVSAFLDQETGKLEVVSGISVHCSGLKNGIVTDIKQVSVAVANVVNKLEEEAQQDLGGLYIALRGEHLKSEVGHGTYNISRADKEITADDIERVISNASSISIKSDHEIISVIPQGFSIDRQRGITNPEGMDGSSLEVDVYITTGLSSALNNVRKSINKVGYRIDGSFYGLMCLCENVLLKEEKELGAVLIDLGGETTSIGICVDGVLQYSKEFDFGCDLITGDIANAL
ncbi:MAG: cell division protein FtsA, partial [Campylobacter sp.]|nr:cell division protein FtsA [Campylobacter sp.]